MIYAIMIVSWVLYTIFEGYREAYYWHYKMNTNDYSETHQKDLHAVFTMQRGVVSVLIFFALTFVLNLWASCLILIANTFIFSFLHNGIMYNTRYILSKKLHPNDETKWLYPKKWFAQSTTSTAYLTKFMTPMVRTSLFIVGLISYLYVYFTYINIW